MGRNKKTNMTVKVLAITLMFTMTMVLGGVASAGVVPVGISYQDDTVFKTDKGAKVSISVNDADIRDILSLFATKLGVNIVYIGNNFSTSFSIQDVDATTAFEIFMKSTSADGAGLSFVREGDLLLIGSANVLSNSFSSMLVLTSFELEYMSAQELSGYLSQLGVKIKSLILDESSNRLFVQGFPYEVAKVNEIVNLLDRAEYYPGGSSADDAVFNLVPYRLKYISAATLVGVMDNLSVNADTIIMGASPEILWVSTDFGQHSIISQLITKLDTIDNISDNEFGVYRLKYINIDLVNTAMSELGLWVTTEGASGPVTVIPNTVLSESPYAILVNFKYLNKEMVDFLIAELDTPSNLPEDPRFFIYTFRNISAKLAYDRINSFGDKKAFDSSEVEFKEFSFSGLGSQLMVLCTQSEESAVRVFLNEIDKSSKVMLVVVDSAGGEPGARTRLQGRIPFISFLSGVPEVNIYISGNISKNATPLYLMWVEDTIENIEKVKEAISNMESAN